MSELDDCHRPVRIGEHQRTAARVRRRAHHRQRFVDGGGQRKDAGHQEVAQQADVETGFGAVDVGQYLFGHQLGASVRVRAEEPGILGDRALFRVAVNGGGGGKDQVEDIEVDLKLFMYGNFFFLFALFEFFLVIEQNKEPFVDFFFLDVYWFILVERYLIPE